ncbi:MAG: ribonuclease P protein component [Bacteroidetes bacterium]|nr:ribonuclease P protein component [Bacteroidota bacterium]HET6244723.1 ribonuclease P protein component [Bacteroidia bacterium]
MPQTFKKEERLCNRNQIKELFEKGNVIKAYPLKMLWEKKDDNDTFPVQILIAVPKRNIKKAVLRNKIKRRIREGYRKNKYRFQEAIINQKLSCSAVILFSGKEEISYIDTETKIIQLLERLMVEYAKNNQ